MTLDERLIFAKRTMVKYSMVTELETRDHKGNHRFPNPYDRGLVAFEGKEIHN